ncbi:MAG: hypothetical protein ABH840_01130 [Nanoarchaeota archaeon]
MADYEQLKAQLLFKLYRKGKWSGAHTPLKNLFHLSDNASIKESEKAIKELNNLDWIIIKISTGEKHISLNSHKTKEIKEFILRILKIDSSLLG